jgi:hypothetical protein
LDDEICGFCKELLEKYPKLHLHKIGGIFL